MDAIANGDKTAKYPGAGHPGGRERKLGGRHPDNRMPGD